MSRKNVHHKIVLKDRVFGVQVEDKSIQIDTINNGKNVRLVFDKHQWAALSEMIKDAIEQWDEADEALRLLGDSE